MQITVGAHNNMVLRIFLSGESWHLAATLNPPSSKIGHDCEAVPSPAPSCKVDWFTPWSGLNQTKLTPSSENRGPNYSTHALHVQGGLLVYVHLVGRTASFGGSLIWFWCNSWQMPDTARGWCPWTEPSSIHGRSDPGTLEHLSPTCS